MQFNRVVEMVSTNIYYFIFDIHFDYFYFCYVSGLNEEFEIGTAAKMKSTNCRKQNNHNNEFPVNNWLRKFINNAVTNLIKTADVINIWTHRSLQPFRSILDVEYLNSLYFTNLMNCLPIMKATFDFNHIIIPFRIPRFILPKLGILAHQLSINCSRMKIDMKKFDKLAIFGVS